MQIEDGKIKWKIFNKLILTEIFLDLMENRLSFEWNIFLGLMSLEKLRKNQKDLQEQNIEPENLEDRVIFMSMFNDVVWTRRGNAEQCISNSEQIKNYTKKFHAGAFGHSLDLEAKRGVMEKSITLLKENGKTQPMVEQFEESGRPVFKRCFSIGSWNPEDENNKETTHFSADASNTELVCRTIHSANQLSIYGAVARWCQYFGMKSDEEPPKICVDEMLKEVQPKEVTLENSLREVQQNFETLGTRVQFTRTCKEAAFTHEVAVGRFYRTAFDVDDGFGDRTFVCRE